MLLLQFVHHTAFTHRQIRGQGSESMPQRPADSFRNRVKKCCQVNIRIWFSVCCTRQRRLVRSADSASVLNSLTTLSRRSLVRRRMTPDFFLLLSSFLICLRPYLTVPLREQVAEGRGDEYANGLPSGCHGLVNSEMPHGPQKLRFIEPGFIAPAVLLAPVFFAPRQSA